MTPREIAKATGIGVMTIYGMLKSRELPSIKVGERFYVSQVVYREWLAGLGRGR